MINETHISFRTSEVVEGSADGQVAKLRSAIENSYSTGYLTLTSIVQGCVFGYYVTKIDTLTESGAKFLHPSAIGMAFVSITTIVAVWIEYMMGTTVFDWVPSVFDTLIPFALGISQMGIISGFNKRIDGSCWWLAVFYFVAMLAYINMFGRAATDGRNSFLLRNLGRYPQFVIVSCFLIAVGCACSAILIDVQGRDLGETVRTLISMVFCLLSLVNLVRIFLYWRRVTRLALLQERMRIDTELRLDSVTTKV